MYTQPVYRNNPAYLSTPFTATADGQSVSERLFCTCLCLPAGPHVTDAHIRSIVAAIKAAIIQN